MYSNLGKVLCSFCTSARHLVIVAPYIKTDALTRILAYVNADTYLICVTRWNPQDLVVGASDTECRTIVTERSGSFRLHPALHAKYYRSDDAVLIGSANLTLAAMGWSSHSNLEILCTPASDFDAYAFEKNLLDDAREISDYEFERWESITRIATANLPTSTAHQSLLDKWRPAARDPRHLELAYQGRIDDIAASDEQLTAQRDLDALLFPPNLSQDQMRMWASTSLLAAPFTNSVIQLHGMESPVRVRILAETYGLDRTEARRDMETVENWLAFLAPETLSHNP